MTKMLSSLILCHPFGVGLSVCGWIIPVGMWHWLCRRLFLSHSSGFVNPLVLSTCNATELTEEQDPGYFQDRHIKHKIPYGIQVDTIFFTKFIPFQFFSIELQQVFSSAQV